MSKKLQAQIAELLAENAKLRKSLDSEPTPAPVWKIRNGRVGVWCLDRFPTLHDPVAWARLFDPKTVMDGLLLMRDSIGYGVNGEHSMRFRDQDEFEAFQLRLDELIRMYRNLI